MPAAPGFSKIIHPANGNIAEVPTSSLGQHYAAGWAPLDETPEPGQAAQAPAAVRASAVQAGLADRAGDDDDNDGNSSKEGD